jgi:hypothetical protein
MGDSGVAATFELTLLAWHLPPRHCQPTQRNWPARKIQAFIGRKLGFA